MAGFNTRVTIEQPKADPASANDYQQIELDDDENWREYAVRWCEVKTRGSRDFLRGRQLQTDITHVLRTPWDSIVATITPQMRARIGLRRLEIRAAVDVDERHRTVELECVEAA